MQSEKQELLINSILRGYTEDVREILSDNSFDVNYRDDVGGMAPIMYAAMRANTNILEMIIDRPGTDINFVCLFGGTARLHAIRCGNHEAVRLLETAADGKQTKPLVLAYDPYGRSEHAALMAAHREREKKVVPLDKINNLMKLIGKK